MSRPYKKIFFYIFFCSLNFASGVLSAGWRVASWRLLAGASGALVRLPLFPGFVNASGAWLPASARLLSARDDAGVASALLAPTRVTFLFEGGSDVIFSSHVVTDNLDRTAALVARHLSIFITSASSASIRLSECISNHVSVAIVHAAARFVGARNLTVSLTSAHVAFVLLHGLTDGQSHCTVFAVAWVGIVRAGNLSILLACASVAFILVDSLAKIEHSAHVLAAAGVVGTINLSSTSTCTGIATVGRAGHNLTIPQGLAIM